MDEQKLQKLIELAARTGKLYCSPDVYRQLKERAVESSENVPTLRGITLVECAYMVPGTVMAYQPLDPMQALINTLARSLVECPPTLFTEGE